MRADTPSAPTVVGIGAGLAVLLAGYYWLVIPFASALRAQRVQAIQEEAGVAWEDQGDWRCYWLVTDPLHRVCVPPAGR